MTVMYYASVYYKDVPRITKFTQHGELLIGYPPDCAYFETFEEARDWLKQRTYERWIVANEHAKQMQNQHNDVFNITEKDIKQNDH